MKIKALLIGSAITLCLCAFTNPLAEKDIIGQWKVDASSIDSYTNHIIAKAAATNPAMADQLKANKSQMTSVVNSIRLTFKDNFDYVNTSLQGTRAGKWKLTDNARSLELIKPDGTIRKDSILELSSTRLYIINREIADTSLYVRP